MKTLSDFNLNNLRVLVRSDLNVPLDQKGEIVNDFRIKASLATIEYLQQKGAKIILASHLDDPQGKVVPHLSLDKIKEKLVSYLNLPITKAQDCIGKDVEKLILQMKPGQILLLENLRFHKEEELNDENFARELAKLADIYINDAFGTCHKAHASIVGVPKFLPSGAGLLLEKEIRILSNVLQLPWRPLVVIIGGAKITTKIKVIERFLEIADHLILGGQISNVILEGKKLIVGRPFLEPEIEKIIDRIDLTNPKLHFPVDGIIALKSRKEGFSRRGAIGTVKKEEAVFDIGPETIRIFSEVIKSAKMIFWAGPLGMFEEKEFESGTKEIAQAIVRNHSAFKIAGGGDTISALNKWELLDRFDHVSTGGGAMMAFLSGEKLPGIEALK